MVIGPTSKRWPNLTVSQGHMTHMPITSLTKIKNKIKCASQTKMTSLLFRYKQCLSWENILLSRYNGKILVTSICSRLYLRWTYIVSTLVKPLLKIIAFMLKWYISNYTVKLIKRSENFAWKSKNPQFFFTVIIKSRIGLLAVNILEVYYMNHHMCHQCTPMFHQRLDPSKTNPKG